MGNLRNFLDDDKIIHIIVISGDDIPEINGTYIHKDDMYYNDNPYFVRLNNDLYSAIWYDDYFWKISVYNDDDVYFEYTQLLQKLPTNFDNTANFECNDNTANFECNDNNANAINAANDDNYDNVFPPLGKWSSENEYVDCIDSFGIYSINLDLIK